MTDTDLDIEDPGPSDPWPAPAPGTEPLDVLTAPRWIWDAMEPAEARIRKRELSGWTNWAVSRFPKVAAALPTCWYLHEDVIEVLTALHVGYIRSYVMPSPGRDTPEADWLLTLKSLLPELQVPKCARGHEEPTVRQRHEPEGNTFEDYLERTYGPGARPRAHPSPNLAAELLALQDEAL